MRSQNRTCIVDFTRTKQPSDFNVLIERPLTKIVQAALKSHPQGVHGWRDMVVGVEEIAVFGFLKEGEREELPSGIVARVELHKPDAEKVIAEHVSFPNVRGIRQIVNWHKNPKYSFTDHDFLTDDAWLAGFRLLRKYKLSFDLQLYPAQMGGAVELARRSPETLIVVNHAGMPLERAEAGLALWRDGMKRLGAEPNVVVKISGLGMVDWRWSEASIRPFVLGAIDRFGVDRVMFGSNFPVDKLYSSFDTLYGSFERVVASFSESEKDQFFRSNNLRHYRLRAEA